MNKNDFGVSEVYFGNEKFPQYLGSIASRCYFEPDQVSLFRIAGNTQKVIWSMEIEDIKKVEMTIIKALGNYATNFYTVCYKLFDDVNNYATIFTPVNDVARVISEYFTQKGIEVIDQSNLYELVLQDKEEIYNTLENK